MTNDLVSIIIPVYNVAPYLDRCIESACDQTYKNIEIILVDDGSTDESGEICDKWGKKDKRIKVIHKQNGGLSDARNTGLDAAIGVLVFFLDGDDSVKNDLLETVFKHIKEGADLVTFGYTMVYDNKNNQDVLFPNKIYSLLSEEDRVDFIIGPFFKFKTGWSAWNRIYKKCIIDEYNVRFVDNSRIFAEDQCFNLMYLSHCKQVVVIEECLYNYYQRDNSIMNLGLKKKTLRFGQKNELAMELKKYYSQFDDCKKIVKIYSFIHYLILERPIVIFEEYFKNNFNRLREIILNDIKQKSDSDILFSELEELTLPDIKKIIRKKYGFLRMLEKTGRAKWLLTGHSFWYTVLVKWRKGLESIFKKNTNN